MFQRMLEIPDFQGPPLANSLINLLQSTPKHVHRIYSRITPTCIPREKGSTSCTGIPCRRKDLSGTSGGRTRRNPNQRYATTMQHVLTNFLLVHDEGLGVCSARRPKYVQETRLESRAMVAKMCALARILIRGGSEVARKQILGIFGGSCSSEMMNNHRCGVWVVMSDSWNIVLASTGADSTHVPNEGCFHRLHFASKSMPG